MPPLSPSIVFSESMFRFSSMASSSSIALRARPV